ncbi:ABC transporter permease [Haematobacter missouriensis]|uniref:ABC transporter permease n=1 Tax=Haematobacter missouriensis TaxID=366616 RepID=A0A212AI62_9RHOB|nr:ABC transporter permease [Haematobacter missouriensis]OWJ77788.1 ABC transporter permease [Haematobacter missouriensis]OWJ81220.1 ABC transporter permease [Haematobacter missouriensis]
MNWALMLESLPSLLAASGVTLQLLVLALVFGGLLAVPLGLAARSHRRWLRWPAEGYIAFFRGTPLLVQIFLVYYGLAQFPEVRQSVLWPLLRQAWFCAVATLALHTAGYTANIIRGALATVPRGQVEAGEAIGLSRWKVYRLVILPQALRVALPAYSNEVVSMMKATSIASTITILELTGRASQIVARTYAPYEVFLTAAAIYLLIAWTLTRGLRALETRLARGAA